MKKIVTLLLAVIMMLSAFACSKPAEAPKTEESPVVEAQKEEPSGVKVDATDASAETEATAEYAKEITISLQLADLDPGNAWNATRESYQRLVFDTLLYYDDMTGESEMQIAKSVEWADEECSKLHVVLRDDIVFSNGDPVTAEDVQFSFDRNTYASMKGTYDHIDILSPTEFDIVLTGPCAMFYALLSRACCMVVCKAEAETDPNGLALIGSGPYVYDMDSYVAENKIDLTRNELYWGEKNPTEVFHMVRLADAAASAVALQNGDINYMVSVNEADLDTLEANENIVVQRYTSWNFVYMGFNDQTDTTKLTEEEKNFRRAVACAINKEDVVAGLGGGSTMVGMWPYTHEAALTSEGDFEHDLSYNPEKAKEYLAKAGGKTSFTCLVDTSRTYVKIPAQIVQEYLRQVGIEMIIEETDSTGMSALTKWGEFKQDAHLFSNLFLIDLICMNFEVPNNGVNRAQMDNPVVNEAIATAKASKDPAVVNEQYRIIQREVHENVSYLPLAWREMTMAFTKGLENFEATYSPTYVYRNMRLRVN